MTGYPNQEQFADVFTSSESYAARFGGSCGAWLLEVQERALLEVLKSVSSMPIEQLSVLDVGGGHGQIATPLVKAGAHVTVLGSSPECRERVRALETSGRCAFHTGSLGRLPFPDQSFDVVTCFRFLPHIETWHYTIAELCRVARHSVIIDYPTWRSVNFLSPLLFEIKRIIEKNTRTYTLFGHSEINTEFSRHGFRVGAKRGEFVLPMALHRLISDGRVSAALEGIMRRLGLLELIGSPVVAAMVRQR